MPCVALNAVALGYQLLWDRCRCACAVRLFVGALAGHRLDAAQLLDALPSHESPLLLSIHSNTLLHELLHQAPQPNIWIEVPERALHDTRTQTQVRRAHQRGHRLVWCGEPGQHPMAALADCFHKQMRSLTPEESLRALRATMYRPVPSAKQGWIPSPIQSGQIYDALANRALLAHALDDQNAWALVGWPTDDVLFAQNPKVVAPCRKTMLATLRALENDTSMDGVEHALGQDPVLVYRFLRFANSAGLARVAEVQSLRHGLMVLGYTTLQQWLVAQLPVASTDNALSPIRTTLVMRAQLMANLLQPGDEDALRREIYLCGVLSQIDILLDEGLPAALQRVPLPGRISSAVLNHSGPYACYLRTAIMLESRPSAAGQKLLETQRMSPAEVNQALLKTVTNVLQKSKQLAESESAFQPVLPLNDKTNSPAVQVQAQALAKAHTAYKTDTTRATTSQTSTRPSPPTWSQA